MFEVQDTGQHGSGHSCLQDFRGVGFRVWGWSHGCRVQGLGALSTFLRFRPRFWLWSLCKTISLTENAPSQSNGKVLVFATYIFFTYIYIYI